MSNGKIYLDSCCFIDLARKQNGVTLESTIKDENVAICKRIIHAARAGSIEVFTSMITIAECLHLQDGKPISEDVKTLFEKFLLSGNSGVQLVQSDIFVIQKARDIYWNYDSKILRAVDRIHVASALIVGCKEFVTTDKGILNRYPKELLQESGMRAICATESAVLPQEFRQDSLLS